MGRFTQGALLKLAVVGFVACMLTALYVLNLTDLGIKRVSPLPARAPTPAGEEAAAQGSTRTAPESAPPSDEEGPSDAHASIPESVRLIVPEEFMTPSGHPLLFGRMSAEILRACGIETTPADDSAPAETLRVRVGELDAAGAVEGEITLERPGQEPLSVPFTVTLPDLLKQPPSPNRRITVDDLVDPLATPGSFATRVFEAIGQAYGFEPLVEAVVVATSIGQYERRIIKPSATEALAALNDPRALDALLTAFGNRYIASRRTSARHPIRSVDLAATHAALVQLTGQDFGPQAGPWRQWWQQEQQRKALAASLPPTSPEPAQGAGGSRWLWWIGGGVGALVLALLLTFLVLDQMTQARGEAEGRAIVASLRAGTGGRDPVCPSCGTVYNRAVVVSLLRQQSPELFEFGRWTTKFVCKKCRAHIVISGAGGENG